MKYFADCAESGNEPAIPAWPFSRQPGRISPMSQALSVQAGVEAAA